MSSRSPAAALSSPGSSSRVPCRAGDRLRLIRSDGTEGPVVVCRSVEFVDRSGWRPGDPATVGLIIPDLSGHDVTRGDVLAGEAPSSQDGRG